MSKRTYTVVQAGDRHAWHLDGSDDDGNRGIISLDASRFVVGATVTIDEPDDACHRCWGGGKIADTEDGEPWQVWANLRPGEGIAVSMGWVKPIDCPVCQGTGRVKVATA